MTESRPQLALRSGLAVKGWTFSQQSRAELICEHSLEPERVMTLLKLHGVPWDELLCTCAAAYAKLPLLQWLRRSSCPWCEGNVLCNASRGGSIAVLEWLSTVTASWTDDAEQDLLDHAAWCDRLPAAKWLRARGALWPDKFTGQYADLVSNATVHQCWSLSAVQWAVASGSGWLDWHCDDFAQAKFTEAYAKKHATDVLEWAHANGCPCTCGHQQQQQQHE
jgi:hypothetical protein